MSIDPEILKIQESVPCIDCPLVRVCEEYDKEFADRGILGIEMQFSLGDNPVNFVDAGYDIETGEEITQESIDAMRYGRRTSELPSTIERNVIRYKFLQKRLVPRDIGNAYELLRDKTAKVYTFGCEKPYKRFKFFGKLGCDGMVLGDTDATRRYKIRAKQLGARRT